MFRQLEGTVSADASTEFDHLSPLPDVTQADFDALFGSFEDATASDLSASSAIATSNPPTHDALEYLQRAHPHIQEFEFKDMIEKMWGNIRADSSHTSLPELIQIYQVNQLANILCALIPSNGITMLRHGMLLQKKLTGCQLDSDISTEIFAFIINNTEYFFIWLDHKASQKTFNQIVSLWQTSFAPTPNTQYRTDQSGLLSTPSTTSNNTASTSSSNISNTSTTLFLQQYLGDKASQNTPPKYIANIASSAMTLALIELLDLANRSKSETQYSIWPKVAAYLQHSKPLTINDILFVAEKALKWKLETTFLAIWNDDTIQKGWIHSLIPNGDPTFLNLFKFSANANCHIAGNAIVKLYLSNPSYSTTVVFEMFKHAIFNNHNKLAWITWNLIPGTNKFNQINELLNSLKANNEKLLFEHISKGYQKKNASLGFSSAPVIPPIRSTTQSSISMHNNALPPQDGNHATSAIACEDSKKRRLR
jgi:hypothetical protein